LRRDAGAHAAPQRICEGGKPIRPFILRMLAYERLMHDRFKSTLPPSSWTQSAADIAPHLTDWRGRGTGASTLMLKPASTAEIVQIVNIARETRTPLVPQGGNTGLVLGGIPDSSGASVIVSMQRMNKLRSVSVDDAAMTVDSGMILADVQRLAAEHGMFFPLSLGSEGSARIGGLISTNAGGVQVLRYGPMRSLVLGLEAVMADGSIYQALSPLRKDNTGYDIKQLLIGAEGTLGIITGATLKLYPANLARATAFVGLRRAEDAVTLLTRLRSATGDMLSSFELIPRVGIDMVLQHISGVRDPLQSKHAWYILAEATSPDVQAPLQQRLEMALATALESDLIQDAAIASSDAQAAAFWKIRETLPEAERVDGGSVKHDVSVTTAQMPLFMQRASDRLMQRYPAARIIAFGHLGDGNVHFNVRAPDGADAALFYDQHHEDVSRIVHDIVADMDGSISAEHGIGTLKRDELQRLGNPGKLAAMRAIKSALDPHGIMNPGRVI
jgi:FAD/FMN-containing dehydrogenase